MKKLRFAAFLMAASSAVFFTSCDKDDDDANPSKTDMLTRAEWKGSEFLINGVKEDSSGIENERLRFNTNGTVSYSDTDTSYTNNWRFINNESQLVISDATTADTVDITTLSNSNLNLRTSFDFFGTPFTFESRYVH